MSFSFELNESILRDDNTNKKYKMLENQEINKSISIANEIINIFVKNDVSIDEGYEILLSLAESIYLYSTFE